jgi:hypothetical protein
VNYALAAMTAARALLRSRAMRDLIGRLAAFGVAMALLAVAFGFLVATLYLALAEVVEPPLATLLTSLILGFVAGVILLILRLRRPRRAATGTIGVEALLLAATDQVRRDPWSSIATAAVLGAIAEILRSASSRPQT